MRHLLKFATTSFILFLSLAAQSDEDCTKVFNIDHFDSYIKSIQVTSGNKIVLKGKSAADDLVVNCDQDGPLPENQGKWLNIVRDPTLGADLIKRMNKSSREFHNDNQSPVTTRVVIHQDPSMVDGNGKSIKIIEQGSSVNFYVACSPNGHVEVKLDDSKTGADYQMSQKEFCADPIKSYSIDVDAKTILKAQYSSATPGATKANGAM